MEKRAIALALALAIPLLLYGIPYAIAATQSVYVVSGLVDLGGSNPNSGSVSLLCTSSSDFTNQYTLWQAGGYAAYPPAVQAALINSGHGRAATGDLPNGWQVDIDNTNPRGDEYTVQIICQTPITTVAGLGIPQFGSLYLAIALGAVIYFVLSRRYTNRPTISAHVEAK